MLASYGFREGHPEMWAPTFKLKIDKGKDKDKKKGSVKAPPTYNVQRIPSWVDRVLFLSNNSITKASP